MSTHSELLRSGYYAEGAIGLCYSIAGLGLFLRRRDTFPIHGRSAPLVAVTVIVLNIQHYIAGAPYLRERPLYCAWLRVIGQSFAVVTLNAIFLRCFRLLFLFKIAEEQLKLHTQNVDSGIGLVTMDRDTAARHAEKPVTSPTLRFTNRRYLISSKWLLGVLFGLTSFQILIHTTSFAILSNDVDVYNPDCLPMRVSSRIILSFGVFLTVFLGAMAFYIRNRRDNFQIRREILMMFVGGLGNVAVASLLDGMEQTVYRWIPTQITILVQTWYPIWLSFKAERSRGNVVKQKVAQKKGQRSSSVSDSTSLEQVLTDGDFGEARESFKKFLVKEFAVENLLFFQATKELEEAHNLMDDDLSAAILQLYIEFLAPGSPYQVNLPFKLQRDIETHLGECFENFSDIQKVHTKSVASLLGDLSPATAGLEIAHQATKKASKAESSTIAMKPGHRTVDSVMLESVPSPQSRTRGVRTLNEAPKPENTVSLSHTRALSGHNFEFNMPNVSNRLRPDIYKAARKCLVALLENDTYVRWRINWTK